MNPLVIAIILQLVGIIVIIAEFLIPSAGVLSIIAVGILGFSLYQAFVHVSTMVGFIFVCADILILPILVIYGLKMVGNSPATLKNTLSQANGISSQPKELELLLNHEGTTTTDLHPSGIAIVDGKRLDVVSKGGFIHKNTKIIISEISGNQIIVTEKKSG